MKFHTKLPIAYALLAGCLTLPSTVFRAQAVGTVTFGNNNSCLVTNSQTGSPVSPANNIRAALYWAPQGSSSFAQLGAAINVGAPLPGLFIGGTRTTGAETAGGASAQFRVRAWGGGYATYEEAQQHLGVLIGQSAIITNSTGDPAGTPPTPPVSIALHGLKGFTLTTNNSTSFLVLTCATNKTVSCTNLWTFGSPTVTTTCTNTNVTILVISTVTNGTCPQTVTRTWQAADACGNTNICSQVVTVQDTQPPIMSCPTNKTVSCTNSWTFDSPSAVSCIGSNLVVSVLGTVTNDGCPLVITRSWQSVNSCNGLSNTCSQAVTVICTNCLVIQLAKNCPPYPVPPGGTLSFTGTVTNNGSVALTNLTIVNDKPVPNTLIFGPAILAPGAGASFSGQYTVPACSCGPFTDTLTAQATNLNGVAYSNSVTVTCVGTNYNVAGDLNGDGIVDQNELNAVLANYWAHSPWLYMTNAARLCGGFFQFALTNSTGWNFTVLVSTNLTDWTNLPGPAFPVYQFLDPAAASNAPLRYYRLRYP